MSHGRDAMPPAKPMKKSDNDQIDIGITADGQSALSMRLHRAGTLCRQGNGHLPPIKVSTIGMTDGNVFRHLIELLDDGIFGLPSIYDHPDKSGVPITYQIIFAGPVTGRRWRIFPKRAIKGFRFSLGTETKDVGKLLPFFDRLIVKAVELTNEWYPNAMKANTTA